MPIDPQVPVELHAAIERHALEVFNRPELIELQAKSNTIDQGQMPHISRMLAAAADGVQTVVQKLQGENEEKENIFDNLPEQLQEKDIKLAKRQFENIMSEHNYF